MKASEAIEQIQKLIKEHGDLSLFPNRNYIVLLNYKR